MFRHQWKRSFLIACAAALLAAAPAYAGAVGPGVTPITGSGQVGPGVSGPGAAVRDNPNNYYYKSIPDPVAVSYTHLDVYKRQSLLSFRAFFKLSPNI